MLARNGDRDARAAWMQSIGYRYGTRDALGGVTLEVEEGEALAVLGPNGAGKTTLIDCLLGLRTPSEGVVQVLGLSPIQAARKGLMVAMLQGTGLPAFATVGELLRYAARLYPDPLEPGEAARLAGVDTLLGRMTTALSGGQRRRVGFALALVANTPLVVLDEPTEGLDIEGREALWQTLRTVRAGRRETPTIVFTTHDLREADRFADRIVLLVDGRIRASGTPAELKAEVGGARVRFRASPAETAVTLTERTGLPVRDDGEGRFFVEGPDTDRVLRVLAGLADLRELRIEQGTLEDVFRTLSHSDGGDPS